MGWEGRVGTRSSKRSPLLRCLCRRLEASEEDHSRALMRRRRRQRLIYWNEVDRGGHFAANEVPQLFAEAMRTAFRAIRAKTARATR